MSETDRQAIYYETRFAVVMYGGISLAIYINGVAQELYRMVRATARKEGGEYVVEDINKLDHSEKVYREIGEKLGTKFVVDILSGTSAGGLNAIFLAKALTNNQEFSPLLANLWKKVADINTLIYDRESVDDLPVRLEVPKLPPYLLNSQRMAYLLYDAYTRMGKDLAPDESSHFVNELDLYVTATDLYGRNIKLYTSNPYTFPEEKRFRKMFHLRYAKRGNRQNDFTNEDNPFLAFISRCTSAIPPAFEPMTLNDILTLPGVKVSAKRKEVWKKYFEETENDQHLDRPYADGGYLDNKPFSYVTQGLLNRTSENPVDRKLIYIEPSPQNLSLEKTSGEKPNVFENLTKAAVTLPMYEPIREDVENVQRRNRIIERAQETVREVEKHLYKIPPEKIRTIKNSEWVTLGLEDCIERMDAAFGAYITLRINGLMDEITMDIAASRNIDSQSTGFIELHQAVWAAFNDSYTSEPKKKGEEEKATWNKFLQEADIDWRMRRFNFLHGKIDEMLVLGNTLESSLDHLGFAEKKLSLIWEELQAKSRQANPSKSAARDGIEEYIVELLKQSIQKRVSGLFDKNPNDETFYKWIKNTFSVSVDAEGKNPKLDEEKIRELVKDDEFLPSFLKALKEIKSGLNVIQNKLSDARIAIRMQAKDVGQFDEYLKLFVDSSRQISEVSRKETKEELGLSWSKFCSESGDQPDDSLEEKFARQVALLYLQSPYETYEYYDQLTYPLMVANNLGEADVVDIWRISPNDSMVFDPKKEEKYKQKLGGQTLVSFGAFFKKEWRENDIMWGRLDGAEQIIRSLGLAKDEEDGCIQKAQAAILKNEISQNNARLKQILIQDARYRTALDGKFSISSVDDPDFDEVILTAFKNEFSIDLSLEPKNALQLAARSAQVAGKMFEGLSNAYSLKNNVFAKWITAAGQFLFWVTEMATTDSWLHIVARNIFMLLYFAGFFLVAVGSLTSAGGLAPIGWLIIAFTAFLQYANHILAQVLNENIQLNVKAEAGSTPVKQRRPIQWVPPFIQSIGLGALLLLISFGSEKLIGFLAATRETFWMLGFIILFGGLGIYFIRASRRGINAAFLNVRNVFWTCLALIGVFAASIALMDWSFAPLKDKGYSILNLEFANAAQKALILQSWAGREIYAWRTLAIDFLFLISLSAFLWLVWDRYSKRIAELKGHNNLENFCRIMSALAVMGGVFDVVENTAIMGMLAGFSIDKLAPISLIATYLKFIAYAPPALLSALLRAVGLGRFFCAEKTGADFTFRLAVL